MKLNRRHPALLALSLLILGVVEARAQGGSAVKFPPQAFPSISPSQMVLGFDFTVSTPLTVGALSFYDSNGDGLAVSHQVGIWGPAPLNTLLAQVTVTSGSPLLDSFRYATITALPLVPGVTYTVGAFTHTDAQSPGDSYVRQVSSPSYATGFVFGRGVVSMDAQTALVKPTVDETSLSPGLFGPSLVFQPVPEPATWAMVGGGIGTLIGIQRMRRRKAVR